MGEREVSASWNWWSGYQSLPLHLSNRVLKSGPPFPPPGSPVFPSMSVPTTEHGPSRGSPRSRFFICMTCWTQMGRPPGMGLKQK